MAKSVIQEKSFAFSLQVIEAVKALRRLREYDFASQLLRAGTSIGANAHEAGAAHSRRDFVHKLTISSKESRETEYWIKLLLAAGIGPREQLLELQSKVDELIRILNSILLTCREQYGYVREREAEYEFGTQP